MFHGLVVYEVTDWLRVDQSKGCMQYRSINTENEKYWDDTIYVHVHTKFVGTHTVALANQALDLKPIGFS